jgi:hypothetical protein
MPPNVFPARAATLLRNADTIQVLKVGGEEGPYPDGFHGYPIVTTATVEAADQKAFVEAIIAGVAPTMIVHPCFMPHHGVHAVSKGGSVDLVICLLCSRVHVYYSDGTTDGYSPTDSISKALSRPFGEP